ncbi:MAG: GGDEF domain-containing protein [Paracoccaceae bacterium]|nr:GGDEF domain-containing protein [Paracoccaceae bacterium]
MSEPSLCHKMLSVICPMHVVLDETGCIHAAGPTAEKLLLGKPLIGKSFLEIFEVKRPHAIDTLEKLRGTEGAKLHLQLRVPPHRELKGVLMEGPQAGHLVVNLSFGISVVDAVQYYRLSATDFAPTDPTIEMLYLVEAKSLAMDASRHLNHRLQGARVAAEKQAMTDTLTGLKNRRAMDRELANMIANDENFALMHLDLDFFKAVNDDMGHAAGDHVLQVVSSIMLNETRKRDCVARVGGDEFVILLRELNDVSTINQIAKRIINKLSEPILYAGELCEVSASAGTTLSSLYEFPDADKLLDDADAALYRSKHLGRGRHTFYSDTLTRKLTDLDEARTPDAMN